MIKKMQRGTRLGLVLLVGVMMAAVGCDNAASAPEAGRVAVVDLGRLLTATGAEQQIAAAVQQAQAAEEQNLQSIRQQLGLADSNAVPSTPEDAQKLLQAQQQFRQAILEAQQRMQMTQMAQLEQFRAMVRPIAEQVASANGCSVVIELNATVLSYDPASDITDQVLAELPRISQGDLSQTPSNTSPLQSPDMRQPQAVQPSQPIAPGAGMFPLRRPEPAQQSTSPATTQPAAQSSEASQNDATSPQQPADVPELR